MDRKKARNLLEKALQEGGKVLKEYAGTVLDARIKDSISSVVTDADLAAEERILGVLSDPAFPCNIISEEAGSHHRGSAYTWVVDPLDGTSNFAAGVPWYGVIIALFRENEPILGGMYLPADEQVYMAEKGKGARRNGHPVRACREVSLAGRLVAYSFDHSDVPGKTDREMALLGRLSAGVRNIRSTNSLVDFCYVADGRLGAAVNQTTKIWDIAAATLIVREAGGVVTDVTGKPVRFDLAGDPHDRNYTLVAAGRGLHASLMKILDPS